MGSKIAAKTIGLIDTIWSIHWKYKKKARFDFMTEASFPEHSRPLCEFDLNKSIKFIGKLLTNDWHNLFAQVWRFICKHFASNGAINQKHFMENVQ